MGKNKIWPDRQTIRLQHWDYSSNGIYFVTICTKFMKPYFGRIKNSKNIYTPIGNYAIECWESLPTRYDYIELDTFIFMPNHMHGIIRINHDPNNDQKEKSEEDIKDLGSIIRGFKSGVKAYANKNEIDFAWHTRYYERIIRTTEELTTPEPTSRIIPPVRTPPPKKNAKFKKCIFLWTSCKMMETTMGNIEIESCDSKSSRKKYVQFVLDLYKNDPSFVGTSLFELKTYLFQKSRHAAEVFQEAILISVNGEIKVACMFFFSHEMPVLQIGFFEAVKDAQKEVKALLDYANHKARSLGSKKIVIGLNGHVSVGVGMLNNKSEEGPIAFNSIYNKPYYHTFFRDKTLTESTLTCYKGNTDDVLNLINNRSIEYEDIRLRPMDKNNFRNEIELMTRISNLALRETELFYEIGKLDLYDRLKKIKVFLRPYDLLFVMKGDKEIGYLFTHPDYNQILPPGRKLSKIELAFHLLFRQKRIDTIKVNSVCMLDKRNIGLQHLIKIRTQLAKKDGHRFLESNFIFDSNRLSTLFAIRQGYKKHNTYSIFYKEVDYA